MAVRAEWSLSGNLLAMGSMAVWALGFPAAEVLLGRWDMVPIMAGRFAVALAVLVPLWWWVDGAATMRAVPWGRALFVGALGFGGSAWFTLLSQAYTDPVTVAILSSALPIYAVIVDRIWGRARFSVGFFVGMACALVGGLVATWGGAIPGQIGLGALAAIAAGFIFCWGTIMLGRVMPGGSAIGMATVSAVGAFGLFAVLLAGTALSGNLRLPAVPDWGGDLRWVVVFGALGFALSQVLWVAGAARLGLGLASLHLNLAPFYAMLIMLALGGGWSWQQAAGAAIVGAGVVVAQIRTGSRRG